MISYIIEGHEHEYETQTMIQVFLPNERYSRVSAPPYEGICVASVIDQKKLLCRTSIYRNGKIAAEYKEAVGVDFSERDIMRAVKVAVYGAFLNMGEREQPWGILTGIRPAKTAGDLLRSGKTAEETLKELAEVYLMSREKAELCLEVAHFDVSHNTQKEDSISVYVGVPFCPSRCLYCSFTSFPVSRYIKKLPDYFKSLEREIRQIGNYAAKHVVESVYIGGGTPTSLPPEYLERLLNILSENINLYDVKEFTVEAGRPDTVTREILRILKKYNVSRISVNPQTLNAKTLETIGRKHTPEDFFRAYETAREEGFDNINIDLILGLPGETADDVENTFRQIAVLKPKSVTVHTLAVKRASELKTQLSEHKIADAFEMEKMLALSDKYCRSMGLKPYYMYRQKNMIGNFENIGWCADGFDCSYNVKIMEERQTVVAAGAGSVTKIVGEGNDFDPRAKIKRLFDVKGIEEYISKTDDLLERKKLEGVC